MESLLQKLHDTVREMRVKETPGLPKTSYETNVVFVDFIRNQSKLNVYEYAEVHRNPLATLNSAPFKSKFYTTDIAEHDSRVYDFVTSKLADSETAKNMCAGINPEYTKEALEDVELGIFVFGMKEREKKLTEKPFSKFHGFMTCGVNTKTKTLKIDLICARLRGLGTQLMKTIFGYATLYNYQRIKLDAATDLLACFYYPRFNFQLTEDSYKEICEQRPRLRSDKGPHVLVRKLEDKMYPMALELKTYNTKLRSTITAREAARKAREAEAAEAAVEEAEVAAEAPAEAAAEAPAEAAAEAPAEAAEAEAEAEKVENVMAYYQDVVDEAIIEAEAEAEATEGVFLKDVIEDFENQSEIIKFKAAIKNGKIGKQEAEVLLESFLAAAAAPEGAGGGPLPASPLPAAAPAHVGSGRTRKRKRSLKKNKKSRKNKTKTLKRKVGRNTSKKRKNNVH